MVAADLSRLIAPRVIIVSRRCVRKNKFVDFVGEYHLDLIVGYGAVPVIVPRVEGVHALLQSFEPIHGVLLCEGEDVDPTLYGTEAGDLSVEELEDIRRTHTSDTVIDREKDSIELALTRICLDRNIPFLGICRGSQVLNVVCGGTLYQDVMEELSRQGKEPIPHIDYDNYDDHRHAVRVIRSTPLDHWFKESLDEKMELQVNSYHHQGVKSLAERFVPMAFSKDGLVEGFYDPDAYDPEEGKFIIGLQFHPERMQQPNKSQSFDYPGCLAVYQEFVKAVFAYQRKVVDGASLVLQSQKMEQEMEKKRMITRSFSLKVGAQSIKSNTNLSSNQEKRLKQMGATVRNSSSYLERVEMEGEREEAVGGALLGKMSREQLTELLAFYGMMGRKIGMELLERKILGM